MRYLSHDEIQGALFDLLCAFDSFARENGLRYTLHGGTLLGAVRHGGFIPWDDDVDVAMPRSDFERLRTMKRDFDGRYRIYGPLSEDLSYPFIKFCDTKIGCREKGAAGVIETCLWVDVFPLDGIAKDCGEADSQFEYMQRLKRRALRKLIPSDGLVKGGIKRLYQLFAAHVAPASRDYEQMNRLAMSIPFEGSDKCRDIVWSPYKSSFFRTTDFDNMSSLDFRGRLFPVVTHFDEALKSMYGDYTRLPPENERDTHGVAAWRVSMG